MIAMTQRPQPVFSDLAFSQAIDKSPLATLIGWRANGYRTALLTIVSIEGRGPRSVGAQMAVREDGAIQGYLTGGCLEMELALVARSVIGSRRNEMRRYGRGSPYIDMRLPCGTGLDIYFDQDFDDDFMAAVSERLARRRYFAIDVELETGRKTLRDLPGADARLPQSPSDGSRFSKLVKPPVRLDIYGAGLAAVQLAHISGNMGLAFRFFAGDDLTIDAARAMGIVAGDLRDPGFSVPKGDPWSASAVLFHEHEREIPLLEALARREDFYIGTIGSKAVAEQRRVALAAAGLDGEAIDRIVMQAGTVKRARNASEIAIGLIAEVLDRARAENLSG